MGIESEIQPAPLKAVLAEIDRLSRQLGLRVYIVGGWVRDLMLAEMGNEFNNEFNTSARPVLGQVHFDRDLDLVVEGDATLFAAKLRDALEGELQVHSNFITAKIVNPRLLPGVRELDFASARTEYYEQPGALPKVSLASLELDLARRDFTINTLALAVSSVCDAIGSAGILLGGLKQQVIDRHAGLGDLRTRIIKVLHGRSFLDDPTRVFRACRYLARLGGTFAPETEELAKVAVSTGALGSISNTRKLNELKKILAEPRAEQAVIALKDLGVWRAWPFFIDEKIELIVPMLKVMGQLRIAPDLHLDCALRLAAYSLPDQELNYFAQFGFGSRQIKSLERDIAGAKSGILNKRISRAGIVFSRLVGSAAGEQGAGLVKSALEFGCKMGLWSS